MSNKYLPQQITPEVTLVPCKLSKDGKSFIPVHTPLKKSQIEALKKQPWTETEDEFLREFGVRCRKWALIAKEINAKFHNNVLIRNQKHCRERWKNFVDPELKKKPFTKFEDDLIVKLYEKYRSWAKVAKEIKHRNENQVKNRYRALKDKVKGKDLCSISFYLEVPGQYGNNPNYNNHIESLPSLPSHLSYLGSINSNVLSNNPLDLAVTPISSEYPSFTMPDPNEIFSSSFNTNLVSPSVSHTFLQDSKNGLFFNPYREPFKYNKCDTILDNFCDQNFNNGS